jgi:hypothetical protein
MYIDVDFSRAEDVDEIRMETSREYRWPIRLQAEAAGPNGGWTKLTDDPEERPIHVAGSMRRAATYEMHARGVNYLLVKDTDYGADDFRDYADAWGLMTVAKVYGATLYKVIP